ncbi:MAG: C-GCAxxG-C-C family protein [Sedimentisphaerales bacterium]
MKRVEKAVEEFDKGYNCSQAVLSTFCEQFGLDYETALKIATGFGGGMHINGTCGAVTGAVMVLGLKYGNTDENKQAKELTYKKVVQFANKFSSLNGSVRCHDLLECDITTWEGVKIAREKGLFSSICPKLVQDVAEILEEMLEDES